MEIRATNTHWVITWRLDESEDFDRFGVEDGHGWMARLAPVRDELLRGDLRSLYIGWLPAVTAEMVDDDDMEPLSVSGLGSLTAAQQALAEFLEVDRDLLAGAGIGSPIAQSQEISDQEKNVWIDGFSKDEINSIIKQLLEGKGQQAERSIKNRFAAWQRSLQPGDTGASRRMVGELCQNAEKARETRLELYKRVWETPVTRLAKAYGLSDVGFAKSCKKYNIPRPPRGYGAQKAAGHRMTKAPLPRRSSDEMIKISPNLSNQFNST